MKLIIILFTVTITSFGISAASASPEVTDTKTTDSHQDFVVLQTAGYLGFIAGGIGRDYKAHSIGILLGYVPETVGGVEIWQLSLKYAWHPFNTISLNDQQNNLRLDPFHIGMSLIYGMHTDLFVDNPDQYPDGYYPPTALRSTLNMGTSLSYGKKYTLFLEYAALDTGIVAYLRHPDFFRDNYDFFGLEGIGSLAIGIKIMFD